MSNARDMIDNWIRWVHTRPELGRPINLGYGRSMIDVIGAQTGTRDGERDEIKRPIIVEIAEAVESIYQRREPPVRVVLADWYFRKAYAKAPALVRAFELDVGKIRL